MSNVQKWWKPNFFLFETDFFMHLLQIVHSFHSFCKMVKENVGCLATGIILVLVWLHF